MILGAEKEFENAIAAYREAVRLRPNFAEAYYNMGVAYSELAQPEEEIAAYRTAIRFNDKDISAWGNLALSYSQKLMHGDALQAYAKLCELQPDNEILSQFVAFFLSRLRRRPGSKRGSAAAIQHLGTISILLATHLQLAKNELAGGRHGAGSSAP